MKTVAYYKGCLASLSAKELDISTQALAPKVGLELIELERVTCCGAGDIHEAEPDYYLHLNARILAYAEHTGCDTLMTVCNVCTLNLRQANFQLKGDEALLERVNGNLVSVGAPAYSGTVDVQHFLWLVSAGEGYELLKDAAHKGLKGLKIAPFYGCQILRPSKLLGFEDPDRPESLERIIEACGGEAIDYPAKIKCCGFPIIQAREDVALGELIQPIEQASEAGADAIVTPCPLCHLSLDAWQSKLREQTGRDFRMPILHLSQLIGVAAGLNDSELKFKRHVVSVDPRGRAPARLTRTLDRPDGVGARLASPGTEVGSPRARQASPLYSEMTSLAPGVLAVAALAALAWGWFEAGWLRRRVLEVELKGAPPELDGVRIAHLSDLHLGVWGRGRRATEEAVAWVAERRPELVFLTGDLVSRRAGLPLLERLLADLPGAVLVLGNHDFADSRDPFSERIDGNELDRVEGVTVLVDEAMELDVRGRRVQVVGVDPRSYAAREARPGELADAAADLRILLCHFPGVVRRIPEDAFQLVLAGHFHAGQIVLPLPGGRIRLAHLGARDVEGIYRYGGTTLHVSPGLGTTFVPFRFFARPEVTELVVRSA